jgi:hypothetical protein
MNFNELPRFIGIKEVLEDFDHAAVLQAIEDEANPGKQVCMGEAGAFLCTRDEDHDGPHVAGALTHIAAIWD